MSPAFEGLSLWGSGQAVVVTLGHVGRLGL